MAEDRREEDRLDNLNIKEKYDKGDVDFNGKIDPEFYRGYIPTPRYQRDIQQTYYSFDDLGLSVPYTVDKKLPWPKMVDTLTTVSAYEQNGGKCAAFSTMQACTGFHMLRDGTPTGGKGRRFDANTFYCKVRAKMGDPRCDASQGATMPAVGSVYTNWGASEIINGVPQANNPMNGAASYLWGAGVNSIRSAVDSGRVYPLIGILIYQGFLSPKKIGDNYWVYWQEGSWGSALGGHMMVVLDCFDSIKINSSSKGSFLLPNTWGVDFPPCRMSYEAFERLLKAAGMPAEIMICTDRVTGPVGKLELKTATITPPAPVVGDRVQFMFEVENTGAGKLVGIQLGIEEHYGDVNPDGFRGPIVDLEPGATTSFNPTTEPMTPGNKRWVFDNLKPYTVLKTITVDVTGEPPPPPPPPPSNDVMTIKLGELTDTVGQKWTADVDQPEGVKYRKVAQPGGKRYRWVG
jgi:hypothetical protein